MSRPTRPGRRRRAVRPSFEPLEQRRVLDAAAAAIWTITGDVDPLAPDDVIVVEHSPSREGVLRAVVNGVVVARRPAADVGMIRVFSGAGDDSIRIRLPGERRIRTELFGGVGDDTIVGGDTDDTIFGGHGHDDLVGGVGHDRLLGGRGRDSLVGSAGRDVLHGGRHADTLRGGTGRNVLTGGLGVDTFYGDSQRDQATLEEGERLIGSESTNPLTRAQDLAALEAWYVDVAMAEWGPWLGTSRMNGVPRLYERVADLALAATTGDFGGALPAESPDHSGTNNQVAGVDEGDLVKTDGLHLFTLAGGGIDIVAVSPADGPVLVHHLPLDGDELALFLDGARLTVVSHVFDDSPAPPLAADRWWCGPWESQVAVTVVDVSDVANPTILETTRLDGTLVSARSIAGRVIVVTEDFIDIPAPEFVPDDDAFPPPTELVVAESDRPFPDVTIDSVLWPWQPEFGTYEDEASYRARLAEAWADGPLPGYVTTRADGTVTSGQLAAAGSTYRPADATSSSMLSVVAFTVGDDVAGPDSSTSVAGVSGEVYVSTESLYVASTHWGSWWDETDEGPSTNVHKFDLGDPTIPLVAKGSVRGTILDQFSLDEHAGMLRVATTTWGRGETVNGVHVLGEIDGNLTVVGSVTGLAPGETIHSVRFAGDLGYLSTFRQIDPFFVIDLADPTAPTVLGELKVPGFSSYLQVLDESHVLGIGRDADPETGRPLGLQISLFDVSDSSNPVRTATFTFPGDAWGSWSAAQWDHRAVSWFPEHGILALPFETGDWWTRENSLVIFAVDTTAGSIDKIGEVTHGDAVVRSVRIGSFLYSLSATTVKVTPIDDPATVVAEVALTSPPAADDDDVVVPL